MAGLEIELRKGLPKDADFIYRVLETTMRDYVEQTWGAFNAADNRKAVAERIAAGTFSVIRLRGADIGVLCVERHPTHIQLDQLFILPPYQNKGIGTRIVRDLAREAKDAGKPVRLRVLAVNPARALYEREGFRVTMNTLQRIYMELPGEA
jgi:GNAT superfamily N-acetyltransferase